MAKPYKPKTCETAKAVTFSVNFEPIGSGNPNKWYVRASLTVAVYDPEGNALGSAVSGGDLPYYYIMSDIPNNEKPEYRDIINELFAQKDAVDLFIVQQIYNLSGAIDSLYEEYPVGSGTLRKKP